MAKSMQDIILNTLRKERIPCTIIVTNGFQIKNAVIVSFDNFAVFTEADGKQMMLFKHAISSLSPNKSIDIANLKEKE